MNAWSEGWHGETYSPNGPYSANVYEMKMKENELRRINTEHKSDNQESHSLITRFSSMTLDQFQREINTMLNGYTYEEAIKFSPEDFAKFQPGRSERQEKVRNALIAVAPDLENDIKIFKRLFY